MKKIIVLAILLLNTLISAQAQTINTEALDAYWKLVEPLKQGDSLSVETWNNFLQLRGNQIYIKNQGFDKTYLANLRKAMEVVYMPAYASVVAERMKKPFDYWLTYKVNQYKVHEAELKAYQQRLGTASYREAIYTNAWAWLPKRLHQQAPNLTIYLLGIENDAIASGDVLVFTLWAAYNQDKLKNGILAGHEMHHALRKPVAFQQVAEQDKGLLYTLNSILNEGSADMIDKKYGIISKGQVPTEFDYEDFLLGKSDSIIQKIDENITRMAQTNGQEYQSVKYYRGLVKWTSGHCPGYYMADVIVRNGLKNKLLKNIQNPFAFVYLYNQAAKKDHAKPPVFTETSITYLKGLEKKYWLDPLTTKKVANSPAG
ncbi:MAG: DUF5700 domain-containing putative Zn-dependent protease [Janthinobacterium lividum]